MTEILIGAIAMAAFTAGVFFLRFWRASGDRFFLMFALAFWLEGAHRIVAYGWFGSDEATPLHYIVRVIAYGLIIAAIIDKNRTR